MAVAEQASAWDVFEQFERDVCQLGRVGGLLDWDEQVNMPPRGAAAARRGQGDARGRAARAHLRRALRRGDRRARRRRRARRLRARARARGAARARPRRARPRRARARARRWPSRPASRPGRSPAPRPTSRSSAIRSSASSRSGARRPTPSATRAASATTRCSTSTSPDMRVARLEPLLHGLRDELVPFVQEIAARPRPDDAFVHRSYPDAGPARRGRPSGDRDRLRLRGRPPRRGGPPVRLGLRARRRAPDDARAARTTSSPASSPCCTRPGHGLYEQGLTGDDRGHVLRPRHRRSACTSRSRASGRTWSAARAAFWERHLAEVREAFPEQLERRLARAVRARRQPGRAVADPRRGRRGHLPPARLPALRARARAGARRPRRRRSAGGLERAHAHARRRRAAATTASACCRTSTGRPGLVGYFPTYTLGTLYSAQFLEAIERELGPIDGDRPAGRVRPPARLDARARAQPRRARRRPSRSRATRPARRSGTRAFMRYLRAKYGELYDLG